MKAKEYFEKYKDRLLSDDKDIREDAGEKLLIELSEEVEVIAKTRKMAMTASVVPILKELNQKWNAIVNLLEKVNPEPILLRDGFINLWVEIINKNS